MGSGKKLLLAVSDSQKKFEGQASVVKGLVDGFDYLVGEESKTLLATSKGAEPANKEDLLTQSVRVRCSLSDLERFLTVKSDCHDSAQDAKRYGHVLLPLPKTLLPVGVVLPESLIALFPRNSPAAM